MLKHVYKIMGLIFVFVAALWFFGKYTPEANVHKISEIAAAEKETFPIVNIMDGDYVLNRMYGYSSNIAANTIRESITVVDGTKQIKVAVKENDTPINKVNYEIRTVDTGELLDSGGVSALEDNDGYRSLNIRVGSELSASREYSLKITLVTSVSKKIHYYSRLKYYPQDCHLKEKLDFVMDIHNMTIKKDEKIVDYIEPDPGADNTSLAYADIKSSFENITWGKLKPNKITDVVPTIKEINMETGAIQLVYYSEADTDAGHERFYVKEYYRVRYTPERMYLLWFERTVESEFDETLASLNKSELNMGITSNTDMQIVSNDAATRVAFVKNGDIYMYDLASNEINKIHSQYINDEELNHELYRQQDARIISMDEEGNVTFALYGYVSHGAYEGKVAIILYRYNMSEKALEELLYIPFETSYQMLKESFERYCYINSKDVFYFIVNEQIYSYNIISEKLELIADGVNEDAYTALEDYNVIAWESDACLSVLNLESGGLITVPAPEGEYIDLIGGMNGNIIYGRGKTSDISVSSNGIKSHNMYCLEIIDAGGGLMKSYSKNKFYITNAYVNENVVYIERSKKTASGYVKASSDNIINRAEEKKEAVTLTQRVSDKSLTEWYMSFPASFVMEKAPTMKLVNRFVVNEEQVLYLENKESAVRYYVYAKGEIKDSYLNPAEAIVEADKEQGVVINSKHQVVWERGGRFNNNEVSGIEYTRTGGKMDSLSACIYMLLRAERADVKPKAIAKAQGGVVDICAEYIEEPLNLTGCTTDEVLYMVSLGNPVIAMKSSTEALLITGYTETLITVYNPATGLTQNIGHTAADSIFEAAGNVFYSAMKNID
ncbi:MAG: hypothetical protein E7267_01945 [Lachnospiraceae bacterium]|nr:hypothetical protein [Lachnospiraceae bacterium]